MLFWIILNIIVILFKKENFNRFFAKTLTTSKKSQILFYILKQFYDRISSKNANLFYGIMMQIYTYKKHEFQCVPVALYFAEYK
jgi:hypothetical protein